MNENNLNANETPEVVQPAAGAEDEITSTEAAAEPQPRNVEEMSDEEFAEYIQSAQDGTLTSEVQAERTDDKETQAAAENTDEGGDEGSPTAEGDEQGTAEPAQETQFFKTFTTQEEYQSEIDRIVSKRYGDLARKNRESLAALDSVKDLAVSYYGGDGDNALKALIADLKEQSAEKAGVSAEEFDSRMRDTVDARRYREQMKERETQQAQVNDIRERWNRESEDLRAVVPDFDFGKAMQNKMFYDSIVKGMSVATAYMTAQRAAAPEVKKPAKPAPARQPIQQNIGAQRTSLGKVERNIDAMSKEEFSAYIDRLKG